MRYRWGCAAWVVGVAQFFVLHGVVESAWERPYSWARNNISDLGNAHCARQSDPEPRYVCSPQHTLMNVSFVTLGLLSAGVALDVPRPLRWGSVLPGGVALTAFGLFLSHHYLGLGMRGMERVAAFPLPVWAAALGARGLAVRGAR